MPADMPFVQVCTRKYKGHSPGRALFNVDGQKLWLAFEWLNQHNPFYYHVEWREDVAAAWEAENVEIGVTREATELAGQGLQDIHAARLCQHISAMRVGLELKEFVEQHPEFNPMPMMCLVLRCPGCSYKAKVNVDAEELEENADVAHTKCELLIHEAAAGHQCTKTNHQAGAGHQCAKRNHKAAAAHQCAKRNQ